MRLRILNLRLNALAADAAVDLLDAVRHAKSTPEAGPGLSALHVEHCHVLPGVGARAERPINASLLADIRQAVGGGEHGT